MVEFIEYIYQADVDQTLGEIFRVLKIGGRLLLTTPNPGDVKRKAGVRAYWAGRTSPSTFTTRSP